MAPSFPGFYKLTVYLFVIKKNVTVLKRLNQWLKTFNINEGATQINTSLLMIDDEADNASINVHTEDEEPTAINIKEIIDNKTTNVVKTYTCINDCAVPSYPALDNGNNAYPIADIIIENKYTPILKVLLFSFLINIHNNAQHKQFNILYTVTYPLAITNDGESVAVKSLTAWLIQLYPE